MRRSRDLRDAHDREAAQTIATTLVPKIITIAAKSGSEGKLFGSITVADVVDAVREQTGVELERRQLDSEPIKTLGQHTLTAKLHSRRHRSRSPSRSSRPDKDGAWRVSTPPSTAKRRLTPHDQRARPLAPHKITLRWWESDGAAGRTVRRRADGRTGTVSNGRPSAAGCRRTTCRPRSRCSARCCCRATPSAPSASRACAPRTSTARPTSTSSTPSAPCTPPARPADTITVADELRARRAARADRRHRGAARAAERHPGDLQRRPLRPHRAGHGAAAPADPRRRRHRRDGLRRARRRHQGRRRGRVEGVQGRRGPRHRLDAAAQRVDQGRDGPPRGDVRPRRHDHRHGHRLPRPRRAAVRACSPRR